MLIIEKPTVAFQTMVLVLAFMPCRAGIAATIDFEDFASAGAIRPIGSTDPYREAGYTLSPALVPPNANVFDSANDIQMPGNATDWLGFIGGNTISLTNDLGLPFRLGSFRVGPSTHSTSGVVKVQVDGLLPGGVAISRTISDINEMSLVILNPSWSNLTSVSFTAFAPALITGIDQITVTAVPEPMSLAIAAFAILAGAAMRRGFG